MISCKEFRILAIEQRLNEADVHQSLLASCDPNLNDVLVMRNDILLSGRGR